MNLPDKIKPDCEGYFTRTEVVINQLIDCIAEDRRRFDDYLKETTSLIDEPLVTLEKMIKERNKNDN